MYLSVIQTIGVSNSRYPVYAIKISGNEIIMHESLSEQWFIPRELDGHEVYLGKLWKGQFPRKGQPYVD